MKLYNCTSAIYTICTWIYKLNICVRANLRIVYLHISQPVHFPRYQSTSGRNVVKYEQLQYCQTLFQNKNQSLVFQSSCLHSIHLPGTLLNAEHILKTYQIFPDGCVKLTGTNFVNLGINQMNFRTISTHWQIFDVPKLEAKFEYLIVSHNNS